MSKKRERLDELLVRLGLASNRTKAAAQILSGNILVNEVPVTKAGATVPLEAVVRFREPPALYVSRGGEKLAGALLHFQISLQDVVAIDVGASTGGFTDCMLAQGARRVYAIDVGYNQLDFKLRQDERVVVFEKTHARDLPSLTLSPLPTFGTIDVSFISLTKVLPPVITVLSRPCSLLVLVKPQFELGREFVGKGGVVKPEMGMLAVKSVEEFSQKLGLVSKGSVPSVLKGAKKGNQEHFLLLHLS